MSSEAEGEGRLLETRAKVREAVRGDALHGGEHAMHGGPLLPSVMHSTSAEPFLTPDQEEYKKALLDRGILVRGRRRTSAIRIEWPDPAKIQHDIGGVDNHLEMGITLDAAEDFLDSIGFPADYVRSASMEDWNGPLRRQRDVSGYDLVKHIKITFRVLGYEHWSVAEVLHAAGHPSMGVGKLPNFFLSHAQQEGWATTKEGMKRACNDAMPWRDYLLGFLWSARSPRSYSVWIDYFCLRQCQNDFDTAKISALISKIGHTVMLLACGSLDKPVVFTRIFCIYEIHCTVEGGARLSGVLNSGRAFCSVIGQLWKQDDIVGGATGSNLEHVKAIQASVAKDKLNQRVSLVTRRFAACTFEQFVLWPAVLLVCLSEGRTAVVALQTPGDLDAVAIGAAMTGIAACAGAIISVPIYTRLVRRSDATAGASQMVGHACAEICCWHGSATFARFLSYLMFRRLDDLLDGVSDASVLAMIFVVAILCSRGWFEGSSGDFITMLSFVTGGLALFGALVDGACYVLMPAGPSKQNNHRLMIVYGSAGVVVSLLGLVCKLIQRLSHHQQGATQASAALLQSEQLTANRVNPDDIGTVA